MRRTTIAALAAAATTLSLVLLPGTAHAAETITPAEAVADVHAVAAATSTAIGTTGFTEWSTSYNAEDWALAYDPVRHVREERLKYRTDPTAIYLMTSVATYVPIVRNALTRAGLVIAGKPAATWEYYLVPRTEADLSRLAHDDLLDPVIAPDPAKPYLTVISAATRTVSPDGSTQWALTGVDGAGNQVDYTVSSDTTGRLASMHIVRTNARGSFIDDEHISYGKPAIPVLTRADVIPRATLAIARDCVGLRSRVAKVVLATASGAAAHAKALHRGLRASDIRGYAKYYVQRADALTLLIRWRSVTGGALIYATNPFSKAQVAYLVRVRSGKPAITLVH